MLDDEADLARWLGNHGVDVLRFGKGEAKTICHLFGEVDDGKCAIGLEARNGEATVVRSVTNTWIKLRHSHKILVEKQQLLEDGRKRLRKDAGRSLLVVAKTKKGEAWRDAALRTLRAELGLRPETVGFCDEGSVIKKSRSLESPSFPGIATTYTEIHCEAKLLREKLSPAEREHLGLTAAGDADFRTKQNGRGGSIHHFWSWESAAVWRMLGEEFIRPKLIESTSEHEPEPGGSQQEEARVLLKPNLVTHLQGPKMKMKNYEVKALRAAMRRGLIRMWPESAAVEVELLFGGRSGSLVLDTTVRDHKGGVTLACVIKIDKRADLEEELKQTQAILPHLGENAPKILCGGAACFEELGVTMNMGQRTDTAEIGLLAIELVGAAWVSPEFSQLGGKLMSTFEELFKWEVANADGRSMSSERGVFGEVPTVLSDVFSASGILAHVAQSTAKRSKGMAWFAGVVKKLQMRLDEATSVSEKNREPWCRSDGTREGAKRVVKQSEKLSCSSTSARAPRSGSHKMASCSH